MDTETPQDLNLECADCAQPFTWTIGEQRFYVEKGLARPRRCAECRRLNREARAAREQASDDVWR
jgi:hypothetical protein